MPQYQEISITVPHVKFYKHSADIVIMEFEDEASLELKDLAELQKSQVELMGEKPCKVISVICPEFTVTQEVRDFGKTDAAHKYIAASAIVCNTLAHRILGNFFIKIQRPPRPTRMFKDLDSAIAWIENIDSH